METVTMETVTRYGLKWREKNMDHLFLLLEIFIVSLGANCVKSVE